ncbi:MAG: hypothetical protein CMH55_02640 [Myxococcales bacterium]|nr:hypothetical protein [Myxococcales bacterium]
MMVDLRVEEIAADHAKVRTRSPEQLPIKAPGEALQLVDHIKPGGNISTQSTSGQSSLTLLCVLSDPG